MSRTITYIIFTISNCANAREKPSSVREAFWLTKAKTQVVSVIGRKIKEKSELELRLVYQSGLE